MWIMRGAATEGAGENWTRWGFGRSRAEAAAGNSSNDREGNEDEKPVLHFIDT